jgi:hypothetical protein
MRCIDLVQVQRIHGRRRPGAHEALQISYQRRDGVQVKVLVSLTETVTPFGSCRLWFRCPSCGRRCRVLYAGPVVKCRLCFGLRYSSQSETRLNRANRGMHKVERRLGSEPCGDLPPKPKGMHWRTYERLARRHEAYSNQWAYAVGRRFGFAAR